MGRARLIMHLRFIYGLLEGCTAYLRPVRRPYGLFYGILIGLTTNLKHHLEGSLDGTLGEISYVFSFVFYGPVKAITEAIYKWFHF